MLLNKGSLKEPPCGWPKPCSRRGELVVIKRGVKPRINEGELFGWNDDQCDKAMSPTTDQILKRAKEMAAPTTEGEAAKVSSGMKWCTLFKNQKPSAEGESSPDVRESACRCEVDSRGAEWFFLMRSCTLPRVNMKAQHLHNQDGSGYFRRFLVTG